MLIRLKLSIMADYHQGDTSLFGMSADKKCVAMKAIHVNQPTITSIGLQINNFIQLTAAKPNNPTTGKVCKISTHPVYEYVIKTFMFKGSFVNSSVNQFTFIIYYLFLIIF